jgi:hypothetical protein
MFSVMARAVTASLAPGPADLGDGWLKTGASDQGSAGGVQQRDGRSHGRTVGKTAEIEGLRGWIANRLAAQPQGRVCPSRLPIANACGEGGLAVRNKASILELSTASRALSGWSCSISLSIS